MMSLMSIWRSDPALRFNQKYLNLCSEDAQKSYGVEQHEGDFSFLGWTIPSGNLNNIKP